MFKKILACILCLFMVGCSTQTTSTSHKIKVVTTTFPSYDALRAIIGRRYHQGPECRYVCLYGW
ncbi:hypothetical protein [Sharpea azabuensis]|uniref:hypothetical protein n=1 Tax=Sharpea azabuensis TaxID=322505 RepID=UPI001569BCB7|nr:hypothetical protein [Sharpea azabuensis]